MPALADELISLYNRFRIKGWLPGGEGALATVQIISETSKKVFVTPARSRKPDLVPGDLFVLRNLYGNQDIQSPINKSDWGLTLPDSTNILLKVMANRGALAVAQLCTSWTSLAARHALRTWEKKSLGLPNIMRLDHWPLLKEWGGQVSIELPVVSFGSDAEAAVMLDRYPSAPALIVRDAGIVVWGNSLTEMERKAELLEHLCELEIRNLQLFG